jgi:hypothetical protein
VRRVNADPAGQTLRQVVAMLVLLVVSLLVVAALVGLGWLVFDYLVGNPLPYRDPEAIQAVTSTAPR